ncbi:MAG: MFS transporter [Hyphomicrobiaceae bacterium]
MTAATAAPNSILRNITLLALSQAFFMSVQTMGIATTPLATHAILGADKSLATVPVFLVHVGIMLSTFPASFLMARIGRRGGFTVGALSGVLSGLVSIAGVYQQSFWLLCLGALLQGTAAAFAWYFRFAAADAADASWRPKAISLVLLGGVLAGFIGPQTAKWAVDLFSPVVFAGVYLMISIYSLVVLLLAQGLRIPSLTKAQKAEGARPLAVIVRQPTYIVALASSMFGYAVMTLVMSATPLAMLACGFHFGDSATVIQGHVIAMFLPSFFTGHLITRFGVLPVIGVGAFIQMLCAIVNLTGIDFMNFFVANILVGLGWNFTYVGGTTLLTETYKPAERAKVQASHDFAVYSTTAAAAGLSGVLQAKAGWQVVNMAALPMMLVVIGAVTFLAVYRRRQAQPSVKPAE